jgi:hypothetical protein
MPKLLEENVTSKTDLELVIELWKLLVGPITQAMIERDSKNMESVTGEFVSASYLSQLVTGRKDKPELSKTRAFVRSAESLFGRNALQYSADTQLKIREHLEKLKTALDVSLSSWTPPGEPMAPESRNLVARHDYETRFQNQSYPFAFGLAGGPKTGMSTLLNRFEFLAEARGATVRRCSFRHAATLGSLAEICKDMAKQLGLPGSPDTLQGCSDSLAELLEKGPATLQAPERT